MGLTYSSDHSCGPNIPDILCRKLTKVLCVKSGVGNASLWNGTAGNGSAFCEGPLPDLEKPCKMSHELMSQILDYVVLVSDFPAVLLNIFVLVTAVRLLRSSSGDTIHVMVASMTLGDLLFSAISNPVELIGKKTGFYSRPVPCFLAHYASWLGLSSSGMSLTLMNLDKLIYFKFPLRYDIWVTRRRALASVAVVWLVCSCFTALAEVLLTQAVTLHPSEACVLRYGATRDVFVVTYVTSTVLFCFLPVGSSLFLSLFLFLLTKKQRRAIARTGGDGRTMAQKVRALLFIFVTTGWTCVSLLPFRFFNITRLIFPGFNDWAECSFLSVMGWLLYYMILLNPIINPLITVTIYSPYRRALLSGACRLCGSRRRSQVNSNSTIVSEFKRSSSGEMQPLTIIRNS